MSLGSWPWLLRAISRWRPSSNKIPSLPASNDTEHSFTWLWTCGGKFFGYRLDDALFTYGGNQAGQFAEGDEIYNSAGTYIGELRLCNRLVTNVSKRTWCRKPFVSQVGPSFRRSADLEGIQLRPGFEDFDSYPNDRLTKYLLADSLG